jgi:hypothetical protein
MIVPLLYRHSDKLPRLLDRTEVGPWLSKKSKRTGPEAAASSC